MVTVVLKLTNPDVANKQVTATATYTDDEDGSVKSFSMRQADIETSEQQVAVLNELHSQYETEITKDAAIAAFIADLEVAGSANLQARI